MKVLSLMVALTMIALGRCEASAKDYHVGYAVRTETASLTGMIECDFGVICEARIPDLALSLRITTVRTNRGRAYVFLDGAPNCCSFSDRSASATIVPNGGIVKLPFFRISARAHTNVESSPTGDLFLSIELLDGSKKKVNKSWPL